MKSRTRNILIAVAALVCHELLPEDAETIAAIPAANANEEIVIGGKNTIWKFTAK